MARFFLATYTPLVSTRAGRFASQRHRIKPFVDGSIRREPDLEHRFPAISCLCRAGKFAPRLRPNDVVTYLTRKDRYCNVAFRHRRLTAVLKAWKVFASHEVAAEWYRSQGLKLPSNCTVEGNPPLPLDRSHRIFDPHSCIGDARTHEAWEREYRSRADTHGTFVVCKPLFRDLSWEAPVVEEEHLQEAFGRIPGTQNPGTITLEQFQRFVCIVGIRVLLF